MKLFARLLIAAVVFTAWVSIGDLAPQPNIALLTLQPAEAHAQARPPGPRPSTGPRTTSTGRPIRPISGGKQEGKPPGQIPRLKGKNPVVHYIADTGLAQDVSQAIVNGQLDPTAVVSRAYFEGAQTLLVSVKKIAPDRSDPFYLEPADVRLAILETAPRFRRAILERFPDGGTFVYRELASREFDEPHFRVLLTSFFKLGGREDMARWAATAARSHLERLHSRDIVELRILDGAYTHFPGISYKHEEIREKPHLILREAVPIGKLPSKRDVESPLPEKRANSADRSGTGGGGTGETPTPGGGGGFNGAGGAFGDPKSAVRAPTDHGPHDERGTEKPVRTVLRLMLLNEHACASDWRGKLSIPFGDFSAVLWGEFARNGVFYARAEASNEAGLALLQRVTNQNAILLAYYGCRSEFQTALAELPIRAVISAANDNDRCSGYRPERVPSEPSMICIAGAAGRRGYEVRSYGRMARQ